MSTLVAARCGDIFGRNDLVVNASPFRKNLGFHRSRCSVVGQPILTRMGEKAHGP
jgi:hypothetical protein